MTLTTSVITGRCPFPDDTVPDVASLRFVLSGVDTQGADVLHPAERVVELVAGAIPAGFDLWKNTLGDKLTHYEVFLKVVYQDPFGVMTQAREYRLGTIQIGSETTYQLADLLVSPVVGLSVEAYIAQITTAANDARLDADRAEVAATNAALGTPYGFETVALLKANTSMGYGPPAAVIVPPGRFILAGGYRFETALSGASDQHWATDGGLKLYVRPISGIRCVEAYLASPDATPATNAAAIKKALETAKTNETVCQVSDLLVTDALTATVTAKRLKINLNVQHSGVGTGAVIQINGAKFSHIDISSDANGGSLHALRLENSDKSVVPRTATLKNVNATTQACAAIFTRNCADMLIEPTILSITGNGAHAVRGVWVSDTTLVTNATRIAPYIDGVTIATGGAVDDADGAFAENSNAGHWGGIQFVGGWYNNCQKRFAKANSDRVTIQGNRGRNDLPVQMYAFVSCYGQNLNSIIGNDFEKTGSAGVLYPIEGGGAVASQNSRLIIDKNRASSAVVAPSSFAIRVCSIAASVVIGENEFIGTEGLLKQYGDTGATGQHFVMGAVKFDNLNGPARNAIELTGDFAVCRVEAAACKNPVTGRFFLAAPNTTTNKVIEIIGVTHGYSFGGWQINAGRPLTYSDQNAHANNSYTIRAGKYRFVRDSAPSGGPYEVGDEFVKFTIASGGYRGGVCTAAGSPGTWANWGLIA